MCIFASVEHWIHELKTRQTILADEDRPVRSSIDYIGMLILKAFGEILLSLIQIGLISLSLAVKIAKYLDQIHLFRFINLSKLRFLPSLQQAFQWRIVLPELHETGILLKSFLIEGQSVRNLVYVMNEPNSCKGFLYVDFHHRLFEVAIDFEEKCSRP
jgi:hypothetical protein